MTVKQAGTEYNPDVVTPPGETLQDILEALEMTESELTMSIGTPVSRIIEHNALITPTIAKRLEKVLSTPASFWINREHRYRKSLGRTLQYGSMLGVTG